MTAWISLLRGVNVGGHGKIPMKELAALYEKLGLKSVKTYIQSGNVVFVSDGGADALAKTIEAAIGETFGTQTGVVVFSLAEWDAILAANPYLAAAEADPTKVSVMTFGAPPDTAPLEKLKVVMADGEDFKLDGRALYLNLPNGTGNSKLAAKAAALKFGTVATTRNWRTMVKLGELAEALEA